MTLNSRINKLHDEAMELASHAELLKRKSSALATTTFRKAYLLEKEAALLVAQTSIEPSRSVLLQSAASLAMDCKEYREAEILVSTALCGNPPTEILAELRSLLETIYFCEYLAKRGMELCPEEIELHLNGDAVSYGLMESRAFINKADTMDRMLKRSAQRKLGMPFSDAADVMFETYLSVPRAASYAITIRMGRPTAQLQMELETSPKAIISDVMEGIEEYASGNVDALKTRIPEKPYFENFTALAKKLSPDGKRIRSVSVTNTNDKTIKVDHPPLPIWKPTSPPIDNTFVGVLFSATDDPYKSDASQATFRVAIDQGGTSPLIHVRPGMLSDIVKPYWGARVRVIVSKKRGRFEFEDLEPLDN